MVAAPTVNWSFQEHRGPETSPPLVRLSISFHNLDFSDVPIFAGVYFNDSSKWPLVAQTFVFLS